MDPVCYPGAVTDPDTGESIFEAEVAETVYTAFAGTRHEVPARWVVRRVADKNNTDALFPVWRYHAFLTNTALSTVAAISPTGSTPSRAPALRDRKVPPGGRPYAP